MRSPEQSDPASTVVVLGEALIDVIVSPDGAARAVAGGGPYNAARTVARLGGDVLFLGRLAGDRFGEQLRSGLRADGVRLADLAPSPLPTTLAVAEIDADGAAAYAFYLAQTAAGDLSVDQARRAMPTLPAVLHVGTLGLVLEPVAEAVEAVVADLDEATLLFCDPNCRAGAIADRGGYLRRLHRVLARADVVKVSGEDLHYLAPGTDPVHSARLLLGDTGAGPRVVLLTEGADGVRLLHRGGQVHVPTPSVAVVDTVGAGDAFGAGFVQRWVRLGRGRGELDDLEAVRDAVEYGTRVAALTCTRPGADPPTVADLAAATGSSDHRTTR